jgi:hypothetical protein
MSRPNRPRQAATSGPSPTAWAWLHDAPMPANFNRIELWALKGDCGEFSPTGKTGQQLWTEYREDVLAWWIEEYPGTRPSLWWHHDAPRQPRGRYPRCWFDGTLPEPRRRVGGVGTACHERLAYVPRYWCGVPQDWISATDIRIYEQIGTPLRVPALDPADPPMYESEASYLKRVGRLLPGEAPRLTADDFEPESVIDVLGACCDDGAH